jgi:ubiquinone/menaquinone biosynthesis C-methylase UbiE
MTSQISFFDERADKWEENCYPPQVRVRLRDLIPEFGVKRGERLLDLGTGPGTLIPYLQAITGPLGQIFAMDISFGMIRQARKKIREFDDLVIQANALQLPFKENIFDRVICFAAFPHFEDEETALGEMARVTRPGGVVVISHLMSREELAAHHRSHNEVERDVLPNGNQMDALFARAGFCDLNITDVPGRYLATGKKG